jgi:hypothetical protein
MKTAKINKAFWPIVSTMSVHDVVNGYFGGSNLFAEYRNDFSESGAAFVAEWIEDNVNKPWWRDVDLSAIVESADNLLRHCASEYASALAWIVDGDGELGEKLLRAPAWFDAWGNFYVFARPFSNACTEYWVIRADSEQSAMEELITRFEESFIIDDEEAHEGDYTNDNGNTCRVDGLVCIGEIVEAV